MKLNGELTAVSVIMITYNHQDFIEDAINGVLMQKCNFIFELIIANDHSSDETDAIIQRIISENPQKKYIKYINRDVNVGMINNFTGSLKMAAGNYIAICEGDDYWIDPLKLQKQVDFLSSNKNINVCFHQVNYVDINNKNIGSPKYDFSFDIPQYIPYGSLIENWCINTCSVVFRKVSDFKPISFRDFRVGDQPLFYIINMDKDFYYMPDVMANYRITEIGSTGTSLKKELKSDIEFPFLDKINELSNNKYFDNIERRKVGTIIRDLKFMKDSGNYKSLKRWKFYLKNFSYLFNGKRGIIIAIDALFKYVI